MPRWTSDSLLSIIKKKAFIPTAGGSFSDEDLLQVASEEITSVVFPIINDCREEYYVYKAVETLDGTNAQVVDIPSRAAGMQLREVSTNIGNVERNLPRYPIEDRVYQNQGGAVYGFDIQNNQLTIYGSSQGELFMYYYLRPSELIRESLAGRVATIPASNQVTVSNLPSGWDTSTIFDFTKADPGFDNHGTDLAITAIDGTTNTITFAADLPSSVVVGDWLSEAEYTPVPQVPVDFYPYVAEAVTAYVMASQGDQQGFERAERRKDELKRHAIAQISPRVDGESKKFTPRKNRSSRFWQGGWREY